MSTLNDGLAEIQDARDDMQLALLDKGQTVTKDIRTYATAIANISGGGGTTILEATGDNITIDGTMVEIVTEPEYTRLQYIYRNTNISDNNSAFTFGVIFTSDIYFEFDFSLLSASASADKRLTSPSDLFANNYYFIAGPYEGKFRFILGSNSSQDIGTSLDTFRHVYKFTKSGSYYQMIFDDAVKRQNTTGFLTGDQLSIGNAPSRIYSFKIYEGSTLIRDLIPAKDSNNEVGLYDLVNSRIYKPQTAGAYLAGPEL